MSNPFNAFLSDDDSFVIPSKTEAKKKKPVARKPATKTTSSRQSAPKPVTTQRATRDNRRKTNILEPSTVTRDTRRDRDGGRGRGRAPRPGDVDKRGKRYFDRRSGSGRGRDAKKSGSGGHNWGGKIESQYNTNISINQEKPIEGKGDGEKDEEGGNQKKDTEEKEEEPKEPEKETFTFDQYLKKKEEKRAGVGFENLKNAKVNDVSEGRAYTKPDESKEYLFAPKAVKTKKEKKDSRATQLKRVDDVGFKVKQPERDGERSYRGRGRDNGGYQSRGRGRGGYRGRGGSRGGYQSRGGRGTGGYGKKRVDVDTNDQRNFPSLGA